MEPDFIIETAGYSNSAACHLIFGSISLTVEVGDSSLSGKFDILSEEESQEFHVILGLDILKEIGRFWELAIRCSPIF